MSEPTTTDHAAAMLAVTRQAITNDAYTAEGIVRALSLHGVAVWQLGQHSPAYDWFCTLSHKAAWGDVFYKADHCATLDAAVRSAAREWSATR